MELCIDILAIQLLNYQQKGSMDFKKLKNNNLTSKYSSNVFLPDFRINEFAQDFNSQEEINSETDSDYLSINDDDSFSNDYIDSEEEDNILL